MTSVCKLATAYLTSMTLVSWVAYKASAS